MDGGAAPRRRRMKKAIAAVLVVVSTGCVEPGVTSLDDVAADLARTGAVVRTIGTTIGYPFSVGATRIEIDGHEVLVYEYRDVADREAEVITEGGEVVNGVPANWTGTPRFWADGRVIVVYLGDDTSVIDHLTEVLGQMLEVPDRA